MSHLLHLLAMGKRSVIRIYVESEGLRYWMKSFEITNEPAEVEDELLTEAELDTKYR